MALTKQRKLELAKEYQNYLKDAKNVVVIKQKGIPVDAMTELRKNLFDKDGVYRVVKKRVLLKSVEIAKVDAVELEVLDGSVAVLCAYEDEYAPLKVVQDQNKTFKKAKKEYGFEYVGGRFDGVWKDSEYVTELASIPSKEELIAKLLYMIKYPLQGLAMTLSEMAKKGEGQDVRVADLVAEQSSKEESKDEPKEEKVVDEKQDNKDVEKKEEEKNESAEEPKPSADAVDADGAEAKTE